eukprot:11782647-Karenia_brevis.AAC.2
MATGNAGSGVRGDAHPPAPMKAAPPGKPTPLAKKPPPPQPPRRELPAISKANVGPQAKRPPPGRHENREVYPNGGRQCCDDTCI